MSYHVKATLCHNDIRYRPYPRTCNCEITSFTSGWQIAKGGKGALFYSRIAVNDGKGRRVQ